MKFKVHAICRHTKLQFDVLSSTCTDDMSMKYIITFDLSLNIITHFFFQLAMTLTSSLEIMLLKWISLIGCFSKSQISLKNSSQLEHMVYFLTLSGLGRGSLEGE